MVFQLNFVRLHLLCEAEHLLLLQPVSTEPENAQKITEKYACPW